MEYTGFIQDHDSSLTQKNLGSGDDNLSDLPLCFICDGRHFQQCRQLLHLSTDIQLAVSEADGLILGH